MADTAPSWATRLASVAIVVALIAIAVAVWALRARSPEPPLAGPATGDLKTRACSDFAVVKKAVSLQTHATAVPGSVDEQVVDVNSRLAMSSGALYLLTRLDPATAGDLADEIRRFASDLQEISIYAQAGVAYDDPAEAARLRDAQAASDRIDVLCGAA
ncbi:hypothetical protein [Smaragdicoccus niigatensis]|uniref:hypothetical protein n=1 Tax=Smaragdicoccus niigatensis TaxID=359359 RepID=UPI00038291DF|nr:hypothetical protein [Smaragdicoccus niigatensis]